MAKGTLNRSQLLKDVAEKTGMARREVEQVYEHTLHSIQDAVRAGKKVSLSGFGKFSQRVRAARKAGMGKNPFTGETIQVAARPALKLPKFTPAKQFKDVVSGAAKLAPATKAAPKKAAAKKPAKKSAAKKKR